MLEAARVATPVVAELDGPNRSRWQAEPASLARELALLAWVLTATLELFAATTLRAAVSPALGCLSPEKAVVVAAERLACPQRTRGGRVLAGR